MNQLNQFDSSAWKETKTWREKYDAYLLSDHWQLLRIKAFEKAGNRCEACTQKHGLVGHHMIYREPLESCTVDDIMALCDPCHETFHVWIRQNGRTITSFNRQETVALLRSIPKIPTSPNHKESKPRNAGDLSQLNEKELASFNYHMRHAPKCGIKAMHNYALKRAEKECGRSLKHLRYGKGARVAKLAKKKKIKNPPAIPAQPSKYNIVTRPKIDILEDVIFDQARVILKLQQLCADLQARVSILEQRTP